MRSDTEIVSPRADYFILAKGFQGDMKTQRARWLPTEPSCFLPSYRLLTVSSSVLVHPFHAAAVAVSAWATG